MKKTHLLLILILGIQAVSQAQTIQWTAFSHLSDSLRAQKKPLMIFIHTDWCKYCKMQENTSFKDPELSEQLNQHFYCIKLKR